MQRYIKHPAYKKCIARTLPAPPRLDILKMPFLPASRPAPRPAHRLAVLVRSHAAVFLGYRHAREQRGEHAERPDFGAKGEDGLGCIVGFGVEEDKGRYATVRSACAM